MNDFLFSALRDILDDIAQTLTEASQTGHTVNEADTERIIIDPILRILGYRPLEIQTQASDRGTGSIPDYTLLPNTVHLWFLEAKRVDLVLTDREAAQAINYASIHGARWAVLTNGRTWHIYDTYLHVPLPQKRVFHIADVFVDTDAAQTLSLLSRASMTSDGLMVAVALRQLDTIVRREVETPQSALRRFLQDSVRSETGGTVTDEAIGMALVSLMRHSNPPLATIAIESTSAPVATTPPPTLPLAPPAGDWQTLAQLSENASVVTRRKPGRVLFGEGRVEVIRSWHDMAQAVVQYLVNIYGIPPLPFTTGGRSRKYFLNSEPIRADGRTMFAYVLVSIDNQDIAVDTNRDAHTMASSLLALLVTLNAPSDAVRVELRPE